MERKLPSEALERIGRDGSGHRKKITKQGVRAGDCRGQVRTKRKQVNEGKGEGSIPFPIAYRLALTPEFLSCCTSTDTALF